MAVATATARQLCQRQSLRLAWGCVVLEGQGLSGV